MGGLVAKRLSHRGVLAAITNGRLREFWELSNLVEKKVFGSWAKGRSTVGAGAETKPVAVDVGVELCGAKVSPGDVVAADSDGAVVVQRGKDEEVLELVELVVTVVDNAVSRDIDKGEELGISMKARRGQNRRCYATEGEHFVNQRAPMLSSISASEKPWRM